MADVLSIPGVPAPWMAHPKEYTPMSPSTISAVSSGLPATWDDLDKHLICSPTDFYSIFYPCIANPHLDSHLLHRLSPAPQTLHYPQKPFDKILNQHRLMGRPVSSMESPCYMPLRSEDLHKTAYSQSMSTFMAPPNINGTVSSNASTYCESDFGSLEHFDEPFTTRTAETQTTLVHPAPKSDMSMAANNLSLLSSTEDASYLPSKPADAPQDQQAFLNSHIQAPSIANYDMSTSLNLHPHNSHHVPPTISPSSKHPSYDHTTSWAVWKTNTITDTWDFMQDPNGTSDYGGWHNQDLYSARWSGATNAYAPSEEPNNPTSHTHVMNNESVIASFGPRPVALPSSFPITHQAHAPASAPHVASIEVPNECLLPSQPIYLPNKTVYHHTSFGSPNHRPVNSLSPSAFTPSTTEEDPSPQQSGEERSGIEASMHYSDERNAFLIDCKRRGLSYKDIKRVGGFKEAESTLRGRYRTLTKSKDQRVRKPKWQDKDIRLLCEAVSIHTETPNTYGALTNVSMGMNEPPKVSWKKVAEHIWSQGGTYHFGNATCKKKWCEIHNMTL